MRPATSAIQNLLGPNWTSESQIAIPDLYIFTLQTGEVLYYSGWQTPILAPLPNTSTPLQIFTFGPGFRRTKARFQVGTTVDELEIDISVKQSDLIGTLTWQQTAFFGLFDGATCQVLRCFMQWQNPGWEVIGTITWFYGRVGDIDVGRTRLKMKVKSLLDLLTVQMPKRLYQAACGYHFGDTRCLYDRVAGKNGHGTLTGIGAVNITCQLGSDQNNLITTFVPTPSTIYNNGTVISTSGANNNYTRALAEIDGNLIVLLKPWSFTVVPGVDTFTLLPGCDKTMSTCQIFNNFDFFGGFPYIPPPEAAL